MKQRLIKLLKAVLSRMQADGQPRDGLASAPHCPAVPSNVIVALDRLILEACVLQLDLLPNHNPGLLRAAQHLGGGLVKVRETIVGLSAEAPADNNPPDRAAGCGRGEG